MQRDTNIENSSLSLPWNPKELKSLVTLVKEYGRNFQAIASQIGTKTARDCQLKATMIFSWMKIGKLPMDAVYRAKI